jgi:hypothetical protein
MLRREILLLIFLKWPIGLLSASAVAKEGVDYNAYEFCF